MSNWVMGPHLGGSSGLQAVRPTRDCRPERCELRLNVGVFFDGTGNNAGWVEPGERATQKVRQNDSNVYRLWSAFPDLPEQGYFPAYMPGLGTPFPEIGEIKPADNGMGFGEGGEGRVLFGLLHVMNALHTAVDAGRRPMFQPATVKSLCSAHQFVQAPPSTLLKHQAALKPVGLHQNGGGGLLTHWPFGTGNQQRFFAEQGTKLAQKLASSNKPKVVEVFIDVFGFSRGAAEARVFCTWLGNLFKGDTLFGVKAHIRFLGIFDTVASVGMPASATDFTDGHLDWADDKNLRISHKVKNCVHYVAGHENRGSFPVDTVRLPSGALQANCHEFVFPGMHSDVGGGYTPLDQGRGPGRRNADKLSQIPLNAMYEAARAAKVPLDKARATEGTYDPFAVSSEVREAYEGWRVASGGAKPLREWLLQYLTWRYQVRNEYTKLSWVERASAKDRDDLIGANGTLLADVVALQGELGGMQRSLEETIKMLVPATRIFRRRSDKLAPEAREILRRAKAAPPTSPQLATLFAEYAHDSFAGFRPFDTKIMGYIDPPGSWEPEGYLRWRVHYRGSDQRFAHASLEGDLKQA